MKMKNISFLSLCLLLLASLFSPIKISAAQQEKNIEPSNLYDSIDLPKLEKEKVDKLLDKLKKDKQKPVKDFSFTENEKIRKLKNDNAFVSSQGEIFEGDFSEILSGDDNFAEQEIGISATDNRVKVTDTTIAPYNSMAQIDFLDANTSEGYICSGTFLDKDTVLTAAHCVYDTYSNKFHKGWMVYPGENGTYLPYGGWSSTKVYVPAGWVNSVPSQPGYVNYRDVQYDYAVIKVNSSHTYNLPLSTNSAVGNSITSYGYPGDKGTGTGYYYLYRSAGTISEISYNAIVHTSYVAGGMSGGPILRSGSIISVNSTASWGARFRDIELTNINYWKNLSY